jgi:predicted aldo/keto reductase-like oxidoreductase
MSKFTADYIKENVPLLGFGCMRLPVFSTQADIDIEEFKKMVDIYMESGMNYFDTAYMYHEGKSENAVREAIVKRFPRESFTIADKLPVWSMTCEEDAPKIFNEQLERCGVTYFDYYLLHALNGPNNESHEKFKSYEFCKKMKEEGKIKFFGFSYHGESKDLRHILETHPEFEFVQLQINYFDWALGWAKEQYEIAREFNIPIILMEPVRGGALTEAKLPEEIVKMFTEFDSNASIASWAIRWGASLEGVINVLSGMSTIGQVEDNIKSLKDDYKPLSKEEYAVVEKVAKALLEIPTVPCTECKYCFECPKEIPIPDLLVSYNKYLGNRSLFGLRSEHDKIDKDKNAEACTSCGVCVKVCPQDIDIPAKLSEIVNLLK